MRRLLLVALAATVMTVAVAETATAQLFRFRRNNCSTGQCNTYTTPPVANIDVSTAAVPELAGKIDHDYLVDPTTGDLQAPPMQQQVDLVALKAEILKEVRKEMLGLREDIYASMQDDPAFRGKDGTPGTPGLAGTNGKDGLPGKEGRVTEQHLANVAMEVAELVYARVSGDPEFMGPPGENAQITENEINDIVQMVAAKQPPAPEHFVLVIDRDSKDWRDVSTWLPAAREAHGRLVIAPPPTFQQMPALVVYRNGVPIKQYSEQRDIQEQLRKAFN